MEKTKTKKLKQTDMLSGGPLRRILWFSLPLIAGNLFQQLYYIVDATVIGKFVSIEALAAVNCCSWFIWLLNASARDFLNTVSILASVAVGQHDDRKMQKIVVNALFVTAVVSVLGLAVLLLGCPLILRLFNVSDALWDMAGTYLRVVFVGFPLVFLFSATSALLRAVGNSRITFWAVTAGTVINVVLDLLFVLVFHWSVFGAAFATVIAEGASAVITTVPFVRSSLFPREKEAWKFERKILLEMGKIWTPMAINSLVITIGGVFVARGVNSVGTYFTAGIAVESRIFNLFEAAFIAILSGLSVFIGQNYGAGEYRRIRQGVSRTILFCVAVVAGLNLALPFIGRPMIRLFLTNDNPETYAKAFKVALVDVRINVLAMFLLAVMYMYRIAVQTLGHSEFAMYGGFFQLFARMFWVLVLPEYIGVYAYYTASAVAWLGTIPFVAIPYFYYMKKAEKGAIQDVRRKE
ncbi:MAG: MATE family efflux transporter [Eubacteriales bacterium]|nr:MATE family efflux transporter [Eubacteriales bacterium]